MKENLYANPITSISVIIGKKSDRDVQLPNVNIIVCSYKPTESAFQLMYETLEQMYEFGITPEVLNIESCQVGGYDGAMIELDIELLGYRMHQFQYTIKKPDNSTYTITMALDNHHSKEDEKIAKEIIESIKIF